MCDVKLKTRVRVMDSIQFLMDYWDEMLQVLTRPPAYTTLRVCNHGLRDTVLKNLQKYLDQRSRELADELPPFVVQCHPQLDTVLVVRSSGPYLNQERLSAEAIVDHACGMAVLRGADIYRQGILSLSPGVWEDADVSVYADIAGLCRKGSIEKYEGARVFLGTGKTLTTRRALFAGVGMSGVGIIMSHPVYCAPSLNDTLSDVIFAQNLPSIVCVQVLDPRPGDTVLDMCAAPGGKTNHIASVLAGRGTLIALEKARNKLPRIRANLERWNLLQSNVHIFAFDSTKAFQDDADGSVSPPWPREMFDRILLDGPCSALGQRPYFRHPLVKTELLSYPVLQSKLLRTALTLLKVNGTLVYSTCTITLAENEKMVAWVLVTFPNIHLVKQEPYLGLAGHAHCGLSDEQRHLVQRFDPVLGRDELNHDTVGFFIAKFTKTCV